jgi:hypothetical protein
MDRITKQVYEAYPVTAKEKCCSMHRRKMEYKREQYRKRLIDEQTQTHKNERNDFSIRKNSIRTD